MTEVTDGLAHEVGHWLLAQVDTPGRAPAPASLLGMRWDVLPGVWQPNPGTRMFTSWIPFTPGARFLEVGCAAGVTCVVAARRGCARVVGLDVVAVATENTRRNAARHGVADRVEALTSDLFAELGPDDRFDLVCSNPPLVKAPEARPYAADIERSVFDPGYALHRRFFQEVGPHLAQDGRIYMLTSRTLGDPAGLARMAAEAGYTGRVHRSEEIKIPVALMGASPAAVEAADAQGLVHLDFTMYEFVRSR